MSQEIVAMPCMDVSQLVASRSGGTGDFTVATNSTNSGVEPPEHGFCRLCGEGVHVLDGCAPDNGSGTKFLHVQCSSTDRHLRRAYNATASGKASVVCVDANKRLIYKYCFRFKMKLIPKLSGRS